jgi:hypothetical protein
MKRAFLVFTLIDGYLSVYKDHPVFNGSVTHDIPLNVAGNQNHSQQPEAMKNKEHGVREFVSQGEVLQAVIDYNRIEGKAGKPFLPFVVLEVITKN